MADYRELLNRAIDLLPENTGQARRQTYEKARSALVAQLRAIKPPLPARDITSHRLQLEDSIREVEQYQSERAIAKLARRELISKLVDDAASPSKALNQRAAASRFGEKNGKLSAIPLVGREASELGEVLRKQFSTDLVAAKERLSRTQVTPHFIKSLDRLLACISVPFEEIKAGELLFRSRALEANLATLNLEEFFDDTSVDLITLHAEMDDFRAAFPELLELESNRLALRIVNTPIEDVYLDIHTVAGVAGASRVVDEFASDALNDPLIDIDEATQAIYSAIDDETGARAREIRATLIAQHVLGVRNFVAAALAAAQKEIVSYAKEAAPRLRKGSLDGLEDGARALAKGAFVALAYQLGGAVTALAVGITSFAPLARKGEQLRKVIDETRPSSDDEIDPGS